MTSISAIAKSEMISLSGKTGYVVHIPPEKIIATRCNGIRHMDEMRQRWPEALFYLERLSTKAFLTVGDERYLPRTVELRRFLAGVDHPSGYLVFSAGDHRRTLIARWFSDGHHLAITTAIENTGEQSGRRIAQRIAERATYSAYSIGQNQATLRAVACHYKKRERVTS